MPDHDKEYQDRLIEEHERKRITGFSRAHCWRLERDGKFPRRLYLGPRTVRWRLSEILAWIGDLPTAWPERSSRRHSMMRAESTERRQPTAS
jgi:predicted DNA-binding transcriptional regulator AlpA